SKAAAQLEASKAFAKQIMAEAGVPTAMARVPAMPRKRPMPWTPSVHPTW
ncbi:phosphoribosylamine--Glycine ligase, partial [Arthrobacter sp. Hiyo6]